MKEYHKIQTVFLRDLENNHKTLLNNKYACDEFAYLRNNKWVFTEKVDGTNIRVMFNGIDFKFGGKTDNAQIPTFLLEYLIAKFMPLKNKFGEKFTDGCCFYGEGYGAKIQKGGGNYRQDQSFVLFDIKIGEWWLQRVDVESIAISFNLDTVPIIGFGTLKEMVDMAKEGFKSRWGDFTAEGIVARPETELKTRAGKRIITKIKYKDFEH